MANEAQGQVQEAPAAGGGFDVEAAARGAAVGALGAGGAFKGMNDALEAQGGKVIRWGRVKEAGVVIGGATVLAALLLVGHAAINRQGVFAPKPAAPTPAL